MRSKQPSLEELAALCRTDLSSFIQLSMGILEPNTVYYHNWHIDVIADRLTKCLDGKIKRLIINMPPRYLKSMCASVAFPAWVLANDPAKQVMCVSYGEALVKEFGAKTRSLMNSPKYRALFPYAQLSSRVAAASELRTIVGGRRMGIPAGGAITGRGADIIIMDDILKASEARTSQRESINLWHDENIYQRLNNKNEGVIILIMQRLHEYDLTAHLLAKKEGWELLDLKAIADEDESFIVDSRGKPIKYSRKAGEALHPKIESLALLQQQKDSLGSYVFAAQYQQSPAADTESLIREAWFQQFDLERLKRQLNPAHYQPYYQFGFHDIIQSWDTAFTANESSDFSCCVTIGIKDQRFYILDVFRKKMTFNELATQVDIKQREFGASRVIIEDSPAGKNLIQFLRDKHMSIEAFRPEGDKHSRLAAVSGYVESGLVYVPKEASWLGDFLMEVTRFPNVKNDDQVDALSQSVIAAVGSRNQVEWAV